MPSISDTLARMAALQRGGQPSASGTDRLGDIAAFGNDPGNLRARCYIPDGLVAGAPLVVVLHGCTQTAAGYDTGSGWSTLADAHGFALLYPEQRTANNANRCFNWFEPGDIARDQGEAASIRQMVANMLATHRLDPHRVFVTGLSAGGAMATVMLATYPEVFAGGAIIAGLPYGIAGSVSEALQRMRGIAMPSDDVLAARVRAAAPVPARWPTLSLWHGSADHTVAPVNMEAIVAQWAALHGVTGTPSSETVDGQQRRRWTDSRGRDVIEAYSIKGMAHGTPIDPGAPDGCGEAMAYMLAAGINSTAHIAAFWGLADRVTERVKRPAPAAAPAASALPKAAAIPLRKAARVVAPAVDGVSKVIEDALRAAGLMR